MGNVDAHTERGEGLISKLNSSVAIVASHTQIDILQQGPSSSWLQSVELHPCAMADPLPLKDLHRVQIILIEADPSVPSSMDRVEQLKSQFPNASIIVAMEAADLSTVRMLVRTGVADVVALPLAAEEILQSVIAIMEVRGAEDQEEVEQAHLISFMRALGGSGATTLITHLAAELVDPEAKEPNVCIIDLDMQFGRVAEVLNINTRRTVSDLLDAGDRLDESIFNSVVNVDERGIAVVSAPHEIGPIEAVDQAALFNIIALARRQYEYVLLDLPSNLTNWVLSLVSESDRVLLLTEQNVANLRQARRRVDLLRSIGLDMRLISVILNRADKRLFKTITNADVERALGVPVNEALSNEDLHISAAQEQGHLVGELRRKSAYKNDVARLAEGLASGLNYEQSS